MAGEITFTVTVETLSYKSDGPAIVGATAQVAQLLPCPATELHVTDVNVASNDTGPLRTTLTFVLWPRNLVEEYDDTQTTDDGVRQLMSAFARCARIVSVEHDF